MSVNPHLTDEQRKVLETVEKLYRLAGSTTSSEEAASATARAQELLAKYNLDSSSVGSGDSDGARSQEKFLGGFYDWERDLYHWVAELNFCMHWTQRVWADRPEALRKNLTQQQKDYWAVRKRRTVQHQVVGRRVNVAATQVMAGYLLQTVERLTRQFVAGDLPSDAKLGSGLRNGRAMSFRRGLVQSVVDTLIERREIQLREEVRLQKEAQDMAAEAGASTAGSSSTALTLSTLRQSEDDANVDHIMGAGYSARRRHEKAERERARKKAEDAYTLWALAHPREAAKEEEKRRTERRSYSRRRSHADLGPKIDDWAAFKEGCKVGRTVGIDPQAGGGGGGPGVGHTAGRLA